MSSTPPRSHLAPSTRPLSTCTRILACLHVITLSLTDRAKQCFEVNYFGSMRLIQTFLPALREAPGRGARIVQISSLAGLLTSPGVAVCTFGWEKSPQPTRDAHQSVSLSHGRPAGLRGGGVTAGARRHSTLCAAPQPTCSTQVYSGTKSAMEAMGAALRLELAPSEISVSSINPGCVRTEILNYAKKDDFQLPTDAAQVASC